MNKQERLNAIKDLIVRYPIDTQEEIVTRLKDLGIIATQATVSRDMRKLGIIKVPTADKHYIYGLPKPLATKMPSSSILSVSSMDQFLHINLIPGTAAVVKRQIKDRFGEQIFSIIADDNSILILTKSVAFVPQLEQIIKGW